MRIADAPLDFTLEEALSESYGHFPGKVYLIQVSDGMYAANNVTLADGMNINGLAAFPSADDATTYMGLEMARGIAGDLVSKSFDEARQIAIDKPKLHALLLFVDGRVVDIAFVR